jgi:antitoxin HicB
MYSYPALFRQEGDAVVVTVPDLPEVITNGYSDEEAVEYATDAIVTVLAEYIRRKMPIPTPSKCKPRMRLVKLPAMIQAKVSLYSAIQSSGLRKSDLARRLGWHKFQVERLLDLTHASRMDQIEAACKAMGKSIEIRLRGAA